MQTQQIPQEALIEGRWYVGRGRNANVALWGRVGKNPGRLTFLTIGFTFHSPNVKDEGYWLEERPLGCTPAKELISYGCFQPFMLIDEGTNAKPVGSSPGWDSHYSRELTFPSTPEHRGCVKCGQQFEVVRRRIVQTCPTCS